MTKFYHSIITAYKNISYIGVNANTNPDEISYHVLNNRNWLYFSANMLVILIYSIFFLEPLAIGICLSMLICYSSVIILSYYGYFNISRLFNIHILVIFILFSAIVLGEDSGIINFYFPIILQVFLLHRVSEKGKIILYSLIIIISYTLYNLFIDDVHYFKYLDIYATRIKFIATPFQLLNTIMIVVLAFRKFEDSERALAKQKDYLQNVIDSIPLDIVVQDNRLKYKFVNTTAVKDPVVRNWLVGKSDFDYIKYKHKDINIAIQRQKQLREALITKQQQEFEEIIEKDDEKKITLKVVTPVIDDISPKNNYVICYSIDITRRKQNEEIIRNYSKELEIKNEELKQFAYITSHDLKSPLRNVITLLQLVRKKNVNVLDKNSLELVNTSINSAEHLYRLVNDILLYSTSENTNQETENISLENVVRTIKQYLGNYLIQRNASILIHKSLPIINAHATLINNLFHNLIENGIKYNDSEKPTVTIDYELKDGNYLFSITDNGIGIKAEYQDLIFVVFKRLHNQNQYEGTGIGLSICKKIVEKYGGQIWIESEENKGSTFFFTLPA